MKHLTNQNAQGSAVFNLVGIIAITVAVLYFLGKLAMSGYYVDDAADTTESATKMRIMPPASVTIGQPKPAPAPVEPATDTPATPAPAENTVATTPVETTPTENATAPATGGASADVMATGKQVFDGLCFGCHAANSAIPDSPRLTNKEDWAPRIEKGLDTLVNNAINGFTNKGMMPAKGGNPSLTDDEVKAAVIYMTNESGASF